MLYAIFTDKITQQCMYRTHIQGMYATGQVIQTLTIFWPPNDYCHSGCKPQRTFPLSYTLFKDKSIFSWAISVNSKTNLQSPNKSISVNVHTEHRLTTFWCQHGSYTWQLLHFCLVGHAILSLFLLKILKCQSLVEDVFMQWMVLPIPSYVQVIFSNQTTSYTFSSCHVQK